MTEPTQDHIFQGVEFAPDATPHERSYAHERLSDRFDLGRKYLNKDFPDVVDMIDVPTQTVQLGAPNYTEGWVRIYKEQKLNYPIPKSYFQQKAP